MRTILAVFACLSPFLFAAPAEAANARKGGEIAQIMCGRCHATRLSGISKHPQAPAFRKVAIKYPVEQLQEALAEGITTGHPDMPEFELTTDQIEDMIAYLKTLRRK